VSEITLFSPAKINLYFRVHRRRPDGFHEVSTIIQAISLGDTLRVALRQQSDQLLCKHSEVPLDETNLILRAADLFRKMTGLSAFFTFDLEKVIPLQAGLGGGSSNAATALWAMNHLLKTNISDEELSAPSAELGSDVPFFFSSGRAYCEGRGERVTSVDPVASQKLYLAHPRDLRLSTPKVFAALRLAKDPAHAAECFNDLEPAAFACAPKLPFYKQELLSLGFEEVRLTGSGPTFFCLGGGGIFEHPHLDIFPVHTITRSKEHWYTNLSVEQKLPPQV
jgi:4-diphosphocytidyl-2-C-methyl-D-erythritol kinase